MSIDINRLRQLLDRVQRGETGVDEAVEELRVLPYQDLGFAKVDHHRALRKGFPEVVFGIGKTPAQVAAICAELASRSDRVLVTKTNPESYSAVKERIPDAVYNPVAGTITVNGSPSKATAAGITVVTAGTADIPIAEEATVTASLMGNEVERLNDVGIAGVHRLLEQMPQLRKARVIIVVAGMEGALPGVVSSLVAVPVIAVPTSIGYGANFQGLSALLTMLNSCAPGISVVNIDNGFGAGFLASMINRPTEFS